MSIRNLKGFFDPDPENLNYRPDWKSMSAGLGAGHLTAILEGLGRATHDSSEPFVRMMRRAAALAEPGRNHVLITASASADVLREARRLEALTGGRVTVLAAGDAAERSA